jgi:predicted ATPase
MKESKWYVITGVPGSGKTTLISRLSEMGYLTCPESARLLINKETSKGKPLKEIRGDERKFQKRVFKIKIKLEDKLPKGKIVFLDRGFPDCIAYHKLYGLDTKEILKLCKEKRYKKIFFLEPLPFKKDYARTEDKKTIEKLNYLLRKSYLDLGYEIVTVPIMSAEDRIKFILSKI